MTFVYKTFLSMFRSPTSGTCRMLNGILFNSTRRIRPRHRHADDFTKSECVSGFLQTHQTNYHRSCHPFTHKPSAVHFLYLNRCLPPPNTLLKPGDGFLLAAWHPQQLSRIAHNSTNPEPDKESRPVVGAAGIEQKAGLSTSETEEEKVSIFQRFKRAYKEHGKILVCVHVATSLVWYSSFYAATRCGLDLVPYMEQWGFSETIIKPFRAGGLGDFAVAYLIYKLATPARYTVTLAGTRLVITHLRNRGLMAPKSQEDSLRQLYEDGKQRTSTLRQERLNKLKVAREKKNAGKPQQRKK